MSQEPTLQIIKAERLAAKLTAEAEALKEKEARRIAHKRSLLIGLAQGLEELDREIAASKSLRHKIKDGEIAMKGVRDAMGELAGDDMTFEQIQEHIDLVRKTVREHSDPRFFTAPIHFHVGDFASMLAIPDVAKAA